MNKQYYLVSEMVHPKVVIKTLLRRLIVNTFLRRQKIEYLKDQIKNEKDRKKKKELRKQRDELIKANRLDRTLKASTEKIDPELIKYTIQQQIKK